MSEARPTSGRGGHDPRCAVGFLQYARSLLRSASTTGRMQAYSPLVLQLLKANI